uniref:NADH-ubiquinone oxidoreductase chain 6 n=1 Tax=Coleoptera sp. 20 KM-2017 TaxID=2219324 RepID=A0A346RH98_9COLE|nr:NADH dehydrogenase subunit 6 [Coleoptera sp. 20 KM-2017]
MKILIIMMMMTSMMFMFMKHPLSVGSMLLIQTIFTSLLTSFFLLNSWFSYILFLVMIGGMLVLFIYMTSIASNEMFKFSFKMLLIILMFPSFMFIPEFSHKILTFNIYYSLQKYFSYPNNILLLLMIIYLFITLIAIVKIINIKKGPLRQKY